MSTDADLRLNWPDRGKYSKEKVTPVKLVSIASKSVLNPQNTVGETGNFVIEGNNLDVMTALLSGGFAMRGKIDMMLWDPPYNTGRKAASVTRGRGSTFRYNDDMLLSKKELIELRKSFETDPRSDAVSHNDPSKHTKWLSAMELRLRKARDLLSPEGLFITFIGDEVLFHYGLLLREVFGEENFVSCIPWLADPSGGEKKKVIRTGHEYIVIFSNGKNSEIRWDQKDPPEMRYVDHIGPYAKGRELRKWGDNSQRANRPTMWQQLSTPEGETTYPWQDTGMEGCWRWGSPGKLDEIIADPRAAHWEKVSYNEGVTIDGKDWRWVPYEKVRSEVKKASWKGWLGSEYGTNAQATKELERIFGKVNGKKVFDTPKPISLLKYLINLHPKDDAVVMDCYGGSGSTGHAVLDLNREFGTDRRFILIEQGERNDRFCDSLTAERLRRVIAGRTEQGGQEEGYDAEFTYLTSLDQNGNPLKVTKKIIMESEHDQLADIIIQSNDSAGVVDCRIINTSGYVIGKTKNSRAIALVWRDGKFLTKAILEKISDEALRLGCQTPYLIYAKANDAPIDDEIYVFQQLPSRILAAMGIDEEDE